MIEKYLSQKKCKARFLIGPNGSGKSYLMKKSLQKHEGESLFITEEGNLDIKMNRIKAKPDLKNGVYIFRKENTYGTPNGDYESIKIDNRLKQLILYCEEEINHYNQIKFKSRGQEKISNVFNLLYRTILNSVKVIYIDEPENFLDDLGLRKISKLFTMIENAKIKLVVSSHNFNLCSLLKIPVEHLIFIRKEFDENKSIYINKLSSINKKTIKGLFEEEANSIQDVVKKNKLDQNAGINRKLNYYKVDFIFDSYLNDILFSEDFYRSLFYQKIILVEGPTENRIVGKMDLSDTLNSTYFYVTNGKAFIPFYAKLYQYISKDVMIITDTDEQPVGKSTNKNTAYAITIYLQEKYGDNVIVFNPDLERQFGIDLTEYTRYVESGCAKVYASDNFFSKKTNLNKFKKMLEKK